MNHGSMAKRLSSGALAVILATGMMPSFAFAVEGAQNAENEAVVLAAQAATNEAQATANETPAVADEQTAASNEEASELSDVTEVNGWAYTLSDDGATATLTTCSSYTDVVVPGPAEFTKAGVTGVTKVLVTPEAMKAASANATTVKVADNDGGIVASGTDWSNVFARSAANSISLEGLDTSAVTDMSGLFANCSSATSLSLAGCDLSSVTTLASAFAGCSEVTEIDLSGIDTSKVEDVSYLFAGCGKVASLDLRAMDVDAIKTMDGMFDMGDVTNPALKTITVSDRWDRISTLCLLEQEAEAAGIDFEDYAEEAGYSDLLLKSGENVFRNCVNLVGGEGTTFDSTKTSWTQAYPETSSWTGGYLTYGTLEHVVQSASADEFASGDTDDLVFVVSGEAKRLTDVCFGGIAIPEGSYTVVDQEGTGNIIVTISADYLNNGYTEEDENGSTTTISLHGNGETTVSFLFDDGGAAETVITFSGFPESSSSTSRATTTAKTGDASAPWTAGALGAALAAGACLAMTRRRA